MVNNDTSKQLREVIRILERKLGVLEENEVACCGITMAQYHTLIEIGRARNISLIKLAQLLNLESSTMNRTVNGLVNSGLVKREIDLSDRRYVTISLTDNGVKLFYGTEEGMNLYFNKIYDSIPESKREQIIEGLKILLDAIREKNKCCK